MKKLLFFLIVITLYLNVNSQTNFGIFVGAGFSTPTVKYINTITGATETSDNAIIKNGYNSDIARKIYHVGLNFENVIVERMLYLEFGLQAMNKGYSASNNEIYVNAHGMQIPLNFKYKYFFNKNTENYISIKLGAYASAYYYGKDYDNRIVDAGFDKDYDPIIKFGKILKDPTAEMNTFDFGFGGGIGFGLFGHLHINYNFGISENTYKFDTYNKANENDIYGTETYSFKNNFQTLTLGYYFTND